MSEQIRAGKGPSPTSRLVVCAIAGATMPLAFAPFYWWWLAPLGFAVLFHCLRDASPRQAFARAWCFAAAEFLFGIYWIYISVHQIAGAPSWLAIAMMLGLVVVMAVYPAIAAAVAARWFAPAGPKLWLGALPALLVFAEWLRGWLFTGFGWLAPGYAQTESWLAGFAPVFGVLGVSWAVFVVGGALTTFVHGRRAGRIVAAAVTATLFAAGLVLSGIRFTEPRENEISVALAQGAVPQEVKWRPEQLPLTRDLYRDLTIDGLGSDLVVWPEAAIPDYYQNLSSWVGGLRELADRAGTALMVTMLRWHDGGPQNVLYAHGETGGVYVKRHLVPFGEYFPVPAFARDWMAAMNLGFPDTRPGAPGQPPLDLIGERIAVTICYEDVFGAEQLHSFPEATLLVNVSNDAWFGDSIAPHQHLQIARMRSAEVRRWQLRVTNTGITAVIDPHGDVHARLAQFEPGLLRATVSGSAGTTPYIVWGNRAVLLLAIASLAGYAVSTKLTIRPGT